MSEPVKQPLCVFRGDFLQIRFTARDTNGALIDLTGAEIQWELRTADGTDPIATLAVEGGINVEDQLSLRGQFVLQVPAATTDLTPAVYRHSLRITTTIGQPITAIPPSDFEILVR